MEPPALAAGPVAPVRAAPGASADLVLPLPRGTQPITYHWSRAGASLDDRFTTSDDAGGVRLTVSAAQTGDSGVYTLQASNGAGSDTSKIRLEVAAEEAPIGDDPPSFLRRLQDLTVKVGSRTRFLVEIISSTECKVTWYRNERRLLEAERVALARDGNFWCADVAAVSVDDAGRWTCTAENAGGRASCSAHLNVLVPKAYKRPEFVEELRALLTEQGTVSLECKVVGVPTPVLRWFKDSREIKAGDVFALTANAEDPTSLGTYTCEAVNCMGRAYSSSKVHVVGRTSREGSARPSASGMTPEPPPIFTKELEDAHVKVCAHLTLGCHIVVPPWPRSVVWYNKEGKVEPGERYHVLEDGVGGYLLEIPSAEWADEGEWKCVATSAGGRVGISTCYVAMDVPKNYRKPRFMENLQAVLTEEGLVSFECKVVGFPTPVLSWFKDGQELKPGDVYQLTGTNSLGSYCCIARNCMGQASSSAELTVEDIQNQLNEEEKLQLFSKNQAPKFIQGLKSVEAKIDEPFRFTVKVAIPPEPSVLWYRDDQPVDESTRCHLEKEDKGLFNLDIQNLEFLDQAEWKCVAMNDFGHSVTSCFLKLIIPRHYKKPRFLENLQAILSDEGAVNLECKVIGVPQPVLKWYKDGEELKPGDIHRIISGQDGTCCLGTYTCEAQNCMGIAASSASLLGFDDSMKAKTKKTEEQPLQRNLSLSTIHEERTSQMYDTPVGDITLDDKGEISFSFDGKEVSVSLYETPDLTEEEALQIVEMYADQLSENVTEQNVIELPPLRFVKETSTSGNLLMEAIIIDVSPDYFAAHEEDLRTEADVEDLSIADENGPPQLSLDQDIEIGGEDYLEKTMALLSEERSDYAGKSSRKKSDSQRSADDFFSLSRDQSLSEEKRDDDTHVSESELQSFASARSSAKVKSKSSKPSGEEGQESSEPTKTILLKDEIVSMSSDKGHTKLPDEEVPLSKPKRERRASRGSRKSSTSSEKSISKSREELLRLVTDVGQPPIKIKMNDNEFNKIMVNISSSLTKVINDVQLIERDIILKSELMSSAATASRSLEIISSLITPLSEIHSIADAAKESVSESREVTSTIFNSIPQPLHALKQSLTIIEKCIDMESDNKTLVKKTCVAFIETCGTEVQKIISDITSITTKDYILTEDKVINEIDCVASDITTVIKFSAETIKARNLITEASEIKPEELTLETKHMKDTQKAVFELKSPLNSLLRIVESAESGKLTDLTQIKNSEVLMNNMSASIQDLQTALEQIESLSIKESSSTLQKYNTEIIETVMNSVLKLRGSFEMLSIEPNIEHDKTLLQNTLSSLKENLTEISHKIEIVDKNVGQFDVLQSENKLDILQRMAQILIALENNLPRLETMPGVKSHMDTFHKNLTKVLEKVIESNDAKKYVTMVEICDSVNIINSSIKNLDSENVLTLASLSNTLKIIQTHFANNIFESDLNCSIVNNISEVLVGIQEGINKAEEISLQISSEYIQDFSTQVINEEKVNIVLEHIDRTIVAVNTIKTIETTQELKLALRPTLENICPTLEELRRSVASILLSEVDQDEQVSKVSEATFAQTIATPLFELNQNIIVLNQLIVENIDNIKENSEVITAIAEPLHELHITLEILQQDIISQYGDDLTPYEVSVNMASVVQSIQSCIVMVHEQAGVEGVDEMSTLEDISGIKTSADTLPSDRLVLPTAEEIAIEQSLPPFIQEIATTATAQTLQSLNEHVTVLQTPEVIETLDILSEISDYSSLKSVVVSLGDLHTGLEGILHPVPIEGSIDLEDLVNISKLAAIAEPMQEIQQSLSVLDTSNIPIYENILDLPAEKIHSVFQSISEFKISLEQCMCAVLPAMEIANNTIEISNKISTLREVCEQLKEIFDTSKDLPCDIALPPEVQNLEIVVDSLINATDVSKSIKIDQVKCITEELYSKIMEVQEDLIHFTTQSFEKISQEAKLIQMVSDVETNIAVLEQYDFIDLSRVSDITVCISPQIAIEIDSESLAQIHDIAESAVNVLHDSYQETPIADLMIVEDFYKTCKNEFTILRCLISKATSHKKIIRLLQEFSSLQTMINHFTTKRLELCLSDDVNECLTNFLIHTSECLKNTRTSLVKVIDSQSDMLIKTPVTQLESIHDLKYVLESKANIVIANVIRTLVDVAETSKFITNNLLCDIILELSQPNQIPTLKQEEITLAAKMAELAMIIDDQPESKSLDESTQMVLEKLTTCINKHQDYKDALGTGKTLIILKCLAECATILHEKVTQKQISMVEPTEIKGKENSLKEVLAEMLQPLQVLQTELINIREQALSGTEEDSISIDITTTESIMQSITDLPKDSLQQIELEKSTIDNEDICLTMEVDKEIHTIQDSINSMENDEVAEAVKKIPKPMEDIEKSMHIILSSDKSTLENVTLPKEATARLLHHIDQYTELIEIVEEISAVIKTKEVKETFVIARELRESIAASESIPVNEESKELLSDVSAEQTRLAQKLTMALSTLQTQVLDSANELVAALSTDALQRISQVTAQLHASLVAVTGVKISVHPPALLSETTISVEAIPDHSASVTTSESVVFDAKETMVLEHQEYAVVKDTPKKQNKVTSELLENMIVVSQDAVVVELDQLHQKSPDDIPSIVNPTPLAGTETTEILTIQVAQETETGVLVKESASVIIDSLETATATELVTEMSEVEPFSGNVAIVVDSHKLKTPEQSIEQKEEVLKSAQENLLLHIDEYVSEDIIKAVSELSSIMSAEGLEQSIKIAKELRESIAAFETGTKEEVFAETNDLLEQQKVLTEGLQTALSVFNELTLERLYQIFPSVNKSTIEKVVMITESLKTDLATVKTSQQEVLQSVEQKQQAVKTALQLLKSDETFEQAKSLIEETEKAAAKITQTTVEKSSKLINVEPTPKAAVASDSIPTEGFESSKVLTESIAVVEELVVKQDAENTEEKSLMAETKQDVAAEFTASYVQEEIIDSQQPRRHEVDLKFLGQASVTEPVEVSLQDISKDAILTQRGDSIQIGMETVIAAEPTEVRDEVKVSKQLLPLEARLDSSAITEENVDSIAVTSDLTTAGDLFVDSHHAVVSDENALIATETATVSQLIEPFVTPVDIITHTAVPATATEKSAEALERSNLVLQIDAFVTDKVIEIVNELSNITNTETLKESVVVAKKLRESIVDTDYSATAEEASPMNRNIILEQAILAHTLQDILSTLHVQVLDSTQENAPVFPPDALKRVSDIISNLQDGLATAIVSKEAENIFEVETDDAEEIEEQNSMAQLETLLQDINMKINLTVVNKTTDADDSESLKDTLDEVQTVIIKLKREYDGVANDTLNETLEDLECSVRSVQLQINEESPPELLTEACATLQLLVDNINATQQVQNSQTTLKAEKTENILKKCSNETEETVKLLDIASQLEIRGSSNLTSIVSKLNTIRDRFKFLRNSFLVDADTVIENGVEVVRCLDQIEENIFTLERDVDMAENMAADTRDSIITAVHSVYGIISNMRSTVSSVQKRYMFENYGKPSESLLHSIKCIALISRSDDEDSRVCWKRLSKSLRNVLNHFEDIKFYINLDKTARLPNDAAFTKIILEELKNNILSLLVPRVKNFDSNVLQNLNNSLQCVEKNLTSIEYDSSLEVKNKIPMFKHIATEMLNTMKSIKNCFENTKYVTEITNEETESLDIVKIRDEPLDSIQQPPKLTVTTEQQQAKSIAISETLIYNQPQSIDEVFLTKITEVKHAEDTVVPSTSSLVKVSDIFETSVKYVTEAEILIPLQKQTSLLENKIDSSSSEIVNEILSAELIYPSTDSEETISLNTQQNLTETIKQTIEIGTLNQAQMYQVDNVTDLTLKASTTEEINIEAGKDEVTKLESQINVEVQVETECKSKDEHDVRMQHDEVTAENAECSTTATQVIQTMKNESIEREKQKVDEEKLDSKQKQHQIINQETHCEEETRSNDDESKALQKYTEDTLIADEVTNSCILKHEPIQNQEEQVGMDEEGQARKKTRHVDEVKEQIEKQETEKTEEAQNSEVQKPAEKLAHEQVTNDFGSTSAEKLKPKDTMQYSEDERTDQETKIKQKQEEKSCIMKCHECPTSTDLDKEDTKKIQDEAPIRKEDEQLTKKGIAKKIFEQEEITKTASSDNSEQKNIEKTSITEDEKDEKSERDTQPRRQEEEFLSKDDFQSTETLHCEADQVLNDVENVEDVKEKKVDMEIKLQHTVISFKNNEQITAQSKTENEDYKKDIQNADILQREKEIKDEQFMKAELTTKEKHDATNKEEETEIKQEHEKAQENKETAKKAKETEQVKKKQEDTESKQEAEVEPEHEACVLKEIEDTKKNYQELKCQQKVQEGAFANNETEARTTQREIVAEISKENEPRANKETYDIDVVKIEKDDAAKTIQEVELIPKTEEGFLQSQLMKKNKNTDKVLEIVEKEQKEDEHTRVRRDKEDSELKQMEKEYSAAIENENEKLQNNKEKEYVLKKIQAEEACGKKEAEETLLQNDKEARKYGEQKQKDEESRLQSDHEDAKVKQTAENVIAEEKENIVLVTKTENETRKNKQGKMSRIETDKELAKEVHAEKEKNKDDVENVQKEALKQKQEQEAESKIEEACLQREKEDVELHQIEEEEARGRKKECTNNEKANKTKEEKDKAERAQKKALKQKLEEKAQDIEASLLQKEKEDAEFKQKEEGDALASKNKFLAMTEKDKKTKEEKDKAEKAQKGALKQNLEEEAQEKEEASRIQKEKEDAEIKQRQEEEALGRKKELLALTEKDEKTKEKKDKAETAQKEALKQKLEEEAPEKEEASRLQKEKEDAELKQREEEDALLKKKELLAMKEKDKKTEEEIDKVEKAQKEALKQKLEEEAQEKEEASRLQKEKEDAMKEKDRAETAQKEALKQKLEEEAQKKEETSRQQKEKEDAELKQREEEEALGKKKELLAMKEKDKIEKAQNEALKQKLEEEAQEKEKTSRVQKEKKDAELKQREEEEALGRKKELFAMKEKDKIEKAQNEALKQKLHEEAQEKEEASRLQKENEDAELKQKEEEEALGRKEELLALTEKEKKSQEKEDKAEKAQKKALKLKLEEEAQEKEEASRLQKENEDAELKQREEEETRARKKELLDMKEKDKKSKEKKDKAEKAQKEALKQKLEEEAQEKEEASRLQKEKENAELKQREEEEARARKKELLAMKEKDKKTKEEKDKTEKAQNEAIKQKLEEEAQEKEEASRLQKEKENTELKQREEEQARYRKKELAAMKEKDKNIKEETEEVEKAQKEALEQKQEAEVREKKEETRLQRENEDIELKEKQEKETRATKKKWRAKKENGKKGTEEKEESEKPQKEKELVQLKDDLEKEAKIQNPEAETFIQEVEQEHEETRLHKVNNDSESQQKEDAIARAKNENFKKDYEAVEKATQQVELQQKEEENQLQEDSTKAMENTILNKKQEEEAEVKQPEKTVARAKKGKKAVDIVRKEAEVEKKKEETCAQKEETADNLCINKQKEEAINQKMEDLRLQKPKEDSEKAVQQEELKQKEDINKVKKAKQTNKVREKIEKATKGQEDTGFDFVQDKEAGFKKDNDDSEEFKKLQGADKAKSEVELHEEIHSNKEREGTEIKQKQEEEAHAKIENKKIEKEEEARAVKKSEDNALCKLEKDQTETFKKYEKKSSERAEKEEAELELKQKQAEETQLTKDKEEFEKAKERQIKKNKEDKRKIEVTQMEKVISNEEKDFTKKNYCDEISKKTTKYTERLDESERRDDELHIYKKDSDRQDKRENGNVNHKSRREVSHEQHYIREYQYEPSQTGHKLEAREKPRFVDHNHRDYTMEFARPSGYREKSFDIDKTASVHIHDQLGKNAAIYRAQTIVLDAQLRSSAPPYPDTFSNQNSEPTERRSEVRHRSKATSEARSVISEKRIGLSRDSKRKPVFSTYLTDRTAVEGSRVKLTCSVLSSSDPTVIWYKNGVLLDNKLKYRTKFMDGLITLEVLNAVPNDSAEYSCTIENENGSVNSSANLKVYPSFEASPIPPTFTRSIRDTYHLAENELVLECRIRGQPLPTITWLKDDKSITTNSRYQAYYLADGVCRLAIEQPTPEDSGKYTCKAENSVWSDHITHIVNFTGRESRLSSNQPRFIRQALESRRPHFTNVLTDYKVVQGGTIGLQVEIRGAPTRVEWLREGCSVTEVYRNAKTFVEQGLYTLALTDVTEKESGMYTCRAWNSQCHVDMNAAITVVLPNELDGKPAIIIGRPEKDILISVGEDVNISFRVQGEPRPKLVFMKGIRDITTSQRVCKMTSDDYVKFTLKRSVVSDAGTYCILARNAYGCDRAFVTVVVRQRASSDNLISDWTYPIDDSALSISDRRYKSVPERIPGEPSVVEGGNNWISLGWPKSEPGPSAPVLAYKVESWLLGKEGGARWVELGITPLTSFDAFNLKQGEVYHFRVTPRNRYGWGESVQTSSPIGVGVAGDRPEFSKSLPGQLKVLVGETANLTCSVKGKPAPEVVWMKNGHEIEDDDRRLSSSFNGLNCCLTIKDINNEDEARYSCEATNVHGRASTYARVAVITDRSIWEADAKLKRERSADAEGDYPPQFTMRLRDRRVQATYPVRLTCQVIGSPDPGITWFKDGEEVKPDSRRCHFQDEHFHTLEIAPTTLEDGGVYEAMARNSSGAVSCHCSLVVDKGIRAYVAPEFCCGLEPLYQLTDGEELRISAVVEAYPSVGVTWYRDGVRLRPCRRAIMTLDRDGQIELALAAVTSRDAGVYTCTASNEVGRASTSGKVEVTGTDVKRTLPIFISPDEPYSKEPMFIRKPRSSEAREGDTVVIECEVVGDPKPDVYWLRDFLKPDYYRDSSHFKRMGDGPEYRFEIPHAKLDYTGAYSVVARNQHGEAKAVISLQILAKDPTSNVEAHNVRYGRVEVLPRFSKELTDLLSYDGDAIQFECRLSGHPEPHVRWFHYHELIRECADFETSFDEGTARLKIKQVTAEDEGTYTCEAANNLGKTTSRACLVVYPPGEPNTLSQRLRRPPAFLSAASTPRSTPRSTPARSVSRTPGPESRRLCSPARTLAPSFYTYPFNKVAEEGDSVTLQCAIKGNPAPWATWDKDGVIITPSSRITIKEKDDVMRVLEIDQVTVEDVGVYRITIENELGRQEASARIEVITQKGKFYAGVRAVSPSPRKSLTYRGRRPSTPRQD